MSFTKSIKSLFPGYGQCTSYGASTNVNTNTGSNVTITLNTNTSTSSNTVTPISQAMSNGKIRVRTNVIGVNAVSKIVSITATDGTTTVQLYAGDANGTTAGVGLDETFDFVTNLSLNSFSVVVNVTTNNCTHDVEVGGNY